jgi:hypothetical protein
LSASTAATYIFTAPRTLEPCALNGECSISYPDLIKLPYFTDTTERFGAEKRPKKEKKKKGDFMDNSNVLSKHNREIWVGGGSLPKYKVNDHHHHHLKNSKHG